jgi:hypothetical protein
VEDKCKTALKRTQRLTVSNAAVEKDKTESGSEVIGDLERKCLMKCVHMCSCVYMRVCVCGVTL